MPSLVNPYTTMLLQVAAIFAAGAALVIFAPGVVRRAAVPMAAALLLIVVAVQMVWGGSGGFDSVRASLADKPGYGDREICMQEGGHTDLIPFVRWVSANTPPDAMIAYSTRSFDRPCFQFALLPRRMTSDLERADYVMYLDPITPSAQNRLAAQRALPPGQRVIKFYSPTWALERTG